MNPIGVVDSEVEIRERANEVGAMILGALARPVGREGWYSWREARVSAGSITTPFLLLAEDKTGVAGGHISAGV
jgi:hypothetical protein